MTAQTSYAINQAIALAGLLFAQDPHDIISRDAEGVDGIDFGVCVSRGTDKDKQCVAGADSSGDFLGIAIRSLEREGAAKTGAVKYNETETVGILRNGAIYATCPTGCLPGDPVKANTVTGVLDSGAAGAGETQLDNAYWDTTAQAGALGVIRLDGLAVTAGS